MSELSDYRGILVDGPFVAAEGYVLYLLIRAFLTLKLVV